jgi:hypothetical protein
MQHQIDQHHQEQQTLRKRTVQRQQTMQEQLDQHYEEHKRYNGN